MTGFATADAISSWYAEAARDLPWRAPDRTPWGVLVSEMMLQQTPVARVLPVWRAWMDRWPTPAALAGAAAGDAVRAWGRLGYPRRALRLHACAVAIRDDHAGAVPPSYDDLRALPGIGDYTAAAVAAFAHGAAVAVLDTNVRRVYARLFDGAAAPRSASPTVGERQAAAARLPSSDPAGYSVAVMELGATVCTARAPRCDDCPVRRDCRWLAAGRPAADVVRPEQRYEGTDRQARGRLLAVLRDSPDAVPQESIDAAWPDDAQRRRALHGLITDGLVEPNGNGGYRLPA
ncbi:MAG TPA: A/G-specific adenine glycosylase [Mycobacteriales bacterium]|nr:A/G-specific adenine glycosylase [Mycobacteriales bacterium]